MKSILSSIMLLGIFLFVSSFIEGAIPAQERAALIALYNSTNGDSWTNKGGWKTPPLDTDGFAMPGTEESWYGINLSNYHVRAINLTGNLLSGSIPPGLGNLSQLTELYLTLNRISGTIPPELGNLSQLTLLHLKYNQLSGPIPPQLGNLSNLSSMAMSYNQLSGNIPAQLGNLGKLNILNLGGNQLSGSIPAQLGNLTQLWELKLNKNQLTGSIPPQLGNLTYLQYLYLSDNQLSGSIPSEMGNLIKLQYLLLDSNRLNGEIPASLANLTHIIGLDIGYNCLHTTDSTLRNWLYNYDPDWGASQNNCGTITLTSPSGGEVWVPGSTHEITWSTSIPIGNVKIEYSTNNGSDWTVINSSTPDTGSYSWLIPGIVSSQCRIKISEASGGYPWDISDNVFTIGSITSIIVTSPNGGEGWGEGSSHSITWAAPGSLGNVKIEYSDDNGSSWTGITASTENDGIYDWTVPAVSSSLYLVRISDTGETQSDTSDSNFLVYNGIPEEERTALMALYNSTNGDNWANNSGWKTPPLHTDGFAMPGTEGTWYGIYVESNHVNEINLYSNKLNGVISPGLENLNHLLFLGLFNNRINGHIPPELGNMTNLRGLSLDGNLLTGPIPPELGNLTNLYSLHLSYNQLSGPIPSELGNITGLEGLTLDNNQLSGEIPTSLTNLTNLNWPELDISYNCLYATDPTLRTWLNNQCPGWESEQKHCGTISIITPNGGEAWLVGSKHTIACAATDEVGDVKIEYTTNNGSSWTTISSSTSYPYRYSWTIPDTVSSRCRVRISKASGGVPYELSENTFIIYKGVPSQERTPLIALYNSTDGEHWLDNSGWKTPPLHVDSFAMPGTESSWHGITALNGPVTNIRLGNNHLIGSIPAEIGSLSSLQELRLNSNFLSGNIPTSLQNLTLLDPGSTDLGYNALFTDDSTLKTFLDSKDADWSTTQTVSPSNVSAKTVSYDCIEVSWTPIPYTRDTGGYRVFIAYNSGGPYTLAGTTSSKNKSSFSATGLNPSQTYYFVVQTFTNPHANNSNSLESNYSDEVSAATMSFSQITVTYPTGAETMNMGSTCDIAWQSAGINYVKIELFKGKSSYLTITPKVSAGENTYRWIIPDRMPAGTDYRVKISSVDPGVHISGISKMFSIIANASLVLNSPTGGEVWHIRFNHDITWGSGGIENIKIELFKGASVYLVISDSTPAGPGKFAWAIPVDQPVDSDYKIKISSVDAGIDLSDISKKAFSIAAYKLTASDFDGDGKADILWRFYGTGGYNCLWSTLTGAAYSGPTVDDPRLDPQAVVLPDETNIDNNIVGTGDFNRDGHVDILWRNKTDGTNFVWFMNGTSYGSMAALPSETKLSWDICGAGDFNNDGKVDILWRNRTNGNNQIWLMTGLTKSSEISLDGEVDQAWDIRGIGDFTGDGKEDILWRNTTTGSNRIWIMNGITLVRTEVLPTASTDWQIVGAGDYDGNGKPDIFLRHKVDGRDTVWLMDGLSRHSALILTRVTNLDWKIEN